MVAYLQITNNNGIIGWYRKSRRNANGTCPGRKSCLPLYVQGLRERDDVHQSGTRQHADVLQEQSHVRVGFALRQILVDHTLHFGRLKRKLKTLIKSTRK